MLIALLPLVATTITSVDARIADREGAPLPQVRLADELGNADSIESVTAHGNAFTFVITRGDHRLDIIAKTDAGADDHDVIGGDGNVIGSDGVGHNGRRGDIVDVIVHDRGPYELDTGGLSWLIETMQQTTAVTHLEVDEDGAVTLTTNDGARYMAIPGRGSGGNAEAEARWAGEWDRHEG